MLQLDASQRAAACADHPTQLVLAGPGSGKTTTLVARFRHLVETGTNPRRILAVTFTRKAADEMRRRIAADLDIADPNDLRCFTFHSLAFRCLQRNPGLAGLPDRFDVWMASEGRAVFARRQLYWNHDGDILDIIAAAKEQLLDSKGFAKALAADDEVGKVAARFFEVYEAALAQSGAIDFADMVPKLLRAVADHPAYGRSISDTVDHLLVDEYQDINLGQHRLIEHFRSGGVHLWAVGDDDQTLFTFRAADVRYTLQFAARWPGAPVHILDRNYRSGAAIVEGAKRLIGRNKARFAKDYRPASSEPGSVAVRAYSTPEVEVRQVTKAIAALLRGGMAPRSIAVLYRAGSLGLGFQGALTSLGIPFEVRGAGDLWQSGAAKLFLGSLFYLFDADPDRALERMGVGRRSETTRRKLDAIPPAQRRTFKAACRKVRGIVGKALPQSSADREKRDWSNVCDAVAALAATCGSLDELLARIAEQSRAVRAPSERAVVLSTVHSAKGLEWDAVFVVGLEEGLMPSPGADLEEERRIAYVAVTRAKHSLGLTFAAERCGAKSRPSRFIAEFAGAAAAQAALDVPHADDLMPLKDAGTRRPPANDVPKTATPRRASSPDRSARASSRTARPAQ